MDNSQRDITRALVLDGNAVAGQLQSIFGAEMTASPTVCAHCGRAGALGTLVAFMHTPGPVLRCPACEGVVLRIVETPDAIYLDARGAVYLRVERGPS